MNNEWRLLLVGCLVLWAEKDDYAAIGRSYLVKWSYQNKYGTGADRERWHLPKTAQRTITNNRVNARSRINVHLSRGAGVSFLPSAAKLSSF